MMMIGMGVRERDSRLLSGGCLCSGRRIQIRGLAPRLCPAVAISIRNRSLIRGVLRNRISRTGFLKRSFSRQMGTASGHAHVRGIVDIFATLGKGCFGACSRRRSGRTAIVNCFPWDFCVVWRKRTSFVGQTSVRWPSRKHSMHTIGSCKLISLICRS